MTSNALGSDFLSLSLGVCYQDSGTLNMGLRVRFENPLHSLWSVRGTHILELRESLYREVQIISVSSFSYFMRTAICLAFPTYEKKT